MKLGIFADSFGTPNNSTELWANMLKDYGYTVSNLSRSGSSLFYSFEKFIKNYQNYSHIVFCYTNKDRWPCLPLGMENCSNMFTEELLSARTTVINNDQYDIMKNLVKVHRYIFSEEFNNFIYQSIFDKVNKICKDNNIKLVNILIFDDLKTTQLDIKDSAGSCLFGLNTISFNELINTIGNPPVYDFGTQHEFRPGHLSVENNKILCKIINEQFGKNSIVNLLENNFDMNSQSIKTFIQNYERTNRR